MIVGIDLGTTFCAVARLDESGRPVSVPNGDGDVLTPSAVFLSADNQAVVGQPALDLAQEQPDRVATMIKRRIGRPSFGRLVAGREFRPETLSAIILRKLVQDAERQLGPIGGAVITVPAYFDDTRRQATADAGRIAGINVIDIIDEPSAAALAYTFQIAPGADLPADAPRTVLVYDLGGGTFDVTLVKLGKKRFQTLAIAGDVELGGKDWDDQLIAYVAGQFNAQFGSDPRNDPQSLVMLQAAVERAKRTLSKLEQASVTCTHDGHKMTVPITRAEFENLTGYLLARTRLTTLEVLADAGLTWDKVDRVLMVGGSTHMPMTGKMLRDLTGKEPDKSLAVSEIVARGAAVHAGICAARAAAKTIPVSPLGEFVEINVNSHALGVEVRKANEKINDKLIKKNTQLPATETRIYRTVTDGQAKVRIRILQGDAQQASACISVGECWIEGLPPDLPMGSPVQVKCSIGANGRIFVNAQDLTSGKYVRTEIHRPSGLTAADIVREAAWVQGLKIQ